jgi:hypothetical protein
MPKTRKLGRLPRSYDPRIPHMSALLAGRTLPPLPPSKDYSAGMPAELGMMLNDQLGDCTCAAVYHARQVWTFNALGAAKMNTEPDKDVLKLYERACGYRPNDPASDRGGNEQHVLAYWLRHGAPLGTGTTVDKIVAFVEVDPRITDDVKRTIAECGVAYIGFNVPQNIVPPGGDPPKVWTVDPGNPQIVGGHAVVLTGYDNHGAGLISWGEKYTMTWDFFAKYVDEVYAIADNAWVTAKKTTPAGLTMAQLVDQMRGLTA